MFTKNLSLTARRHTQMSLMVSRSFAAQRDVYTEAPKKYKCEELTWELKEHLRRLGITNENVIQNPTYVKIFFMFYFCFLYFSVSTLYEFAMQPEHRKSIGDTTVFESTITDKGALCVSSGVKTGRVPKEKRIVYDDTTKDVS